nr:MAG TPA: minor tail protein [Caudoviricetes sp.]
MAKDTDGLLLSASLDINKTANNIKKEDINKINAILANDDSARVKIVGGLNLSKTQSLIQSQIATISKNLKLNIGSIDTSGFNTQNITDGLNNIQTQTNQVANSLTNLADKFKRPIKPVLNTDGLIDADKTIEKVQKKFSELGTVSVRGIYGDKLGDDQLEKMIVNIESAQGEVRTLTFQIGELSNAQKKLGEGDLFHLTKGTSDNSGIEKLIISTQKAQDKIKALRTSLTADLEAIRTAWNDTNSNKSVKSTENIESLNAQYSKAEEAIISLGNADDTTFASMAVNADVQIQKLSQMVTQYHNAEKAEKSLQNQVKNYGDKIDSNILKLNNVQNQSTFLKNSSNPQVVEAKKQIADLITEYQTLKNTLQGDLTPDGIQNVITRFDELDKQFKQVTTSANTLKTSISASDTMSKQAQQTELLSSKIKKLIAEINTYKNANSRMMSSNKLTSNGNTFSQELENMLLQLSHCANTEDFQKIAANFRGIKAEAKQLGIEGGTVFTTLWEKLKKFSSWMSMTSVVSSVVMDIRNAIVELKEIDTILTEISKTSDLTTEALAKLGKTSFDSASKYGKKASDYLVGVQEMYRAGFQNAPEMSELSILAQAAGDLSSDAANDYLIATDAAYSFKGSIEKLNAVLDSQNYITNNAAVAMQDMADATSEAASVAAQYGIDIDELSALIAVAVSKTRESGSEVGNALKSIFINLQDTTSKPIQDAFASVDISMTKLVNGSEKLKTPIELIKELSKAFTSLEEGDTRRANILSDIGGRFYHNVQKCA